MYHSPRVMSAILLLCLVIYISRIDGQRWNLDYYNITTDNPKHFNALADEFNQRWLHNTTLRKTIIMLSGAYQGSTLLSESIIEALDLKWGEESLVKGCPPEFFNPGCHLRVSVRHDSFSKCFSKERSMMNRWNPCTSDDFFFLMQALVEENVEFFKDNFSNGKLLASAHAAGFPIFVSMREPQHTFPMDGKWYRQIYDRFLEMPSSDLYQLPAGEGLVAIQNYLKQHDPSRDPSTAASFTPSDVQLKKIEVTKDCLGHYLQFLHLGLVANDLGIPIVKMENVFFLEDEEILGALSTSICLALRLNETECEQLSRTIIRKRRTITHSHSAHSVDGAGAADGGGAAYSKTIFRDHAHAFYAHTNCLGALQSISSFCRVTIPGCATFNTIYGVTAMPASASVELNTSRATS